MGIRTLPRRPLSLVAISAMAALTLLMTPGLANAATGKVAWVADGDTFRLEIGERIRIAGIDSAETQRGQAKCRQELTLGTTARNRARALLKGRTVTFMRVGRSYNRTVALVALDGLDLAATLVRMGGRPRPGWCPVSR